MASMKIGPVVSAALIALSTCANAQEDDLDALLSGADASQENPVESEAASDTSAPAAQPQSQPSDDSARQQPAAAPAQPSPEIRSAPQLGEEPEAERAQLPTIEVKRRGEEPPTLVEPPKARQIEEIIVTATKTETSARDIPVSIQAMKGDDLVEKGQTSLDDILKSVPAVNKTAGQVTIRGVGINTNTNASAGEEAGFFLGEASLVAPSVGGATPDFDPYDLSTVEVLEGPQSTLFGGTALSGAIRYIPKTPEFDSFYGSVRTGYGIMSHSDDSLTDWSAMLNVPISDSFALRGAITQRTRPGFTDDLRSGEKDVNPTEISQWRLMARWKLSDNLFADAIYMRYSSDYVNAFLDSPSDYETQARRVNEPFHSELDVGSFSLTYALDTLSIVGVVNTLQNRRHDVADGGPVLGVPLASVLSVLDTDADVPSYELRVVSSQPSESSWWLLNDWDYLAGLYYMNGQQRATSLGYIALSTIPDRVGSLILGDVLIDLGNYRNMVDVSEKALYVNLTRGLFDRRLEFNIGARVAETAMDVLGIQSYAGIEARQFPAVDNDSRVNPKVALTWHCSDDVNFRISMSEGFRFGGANAGLTVGIEDIDPTFQSDSLRNYEVGMRSDWFDHSLRFDVTAYHIDWSDLQIAQLSPGATAYTSNIGAAEIDGVEAQFIWQIPSTWSFIPDGLTLTAGLSFIDAKTTEAFSSANGAVQAGARLPLSPRESGVIGLSWEGGWSNWDLRSTMQASYAGSRPNSLQATYTLEPYTVYNASLRIANNTWPGKPALTLSGVNLTDEIILVYAGAATLNPSAFTYLAQEPRSIKLSVDFSFGN